MTIQTKSQTRAATSGAGIGGEETGGGLFFEGLRAGTRGPRLGRPQADTLQEGKPLVSE